MSFLRNALHRWINRTAVYWFAYAFSVFIWDCGTTSLTSSWRLADEHMLTSWKFQRPGFKLFHNYAVLSPFLNFLLKQKQELTFTKLFSRWLAHYVQYCRRSWWHFGVFERRTSFPPPTTEQIWGWIFQVAYFLGVPILYFINCYSRSARTENKNCRDQWPLRIKLSVGFTQCPHSFFVLSRSDLNNKEYGQ